MSQIDGSFIFSGFGRIGIVASRFNEFVVKNLIDGAIDCLKRHGVDEGKVDIHWVPGSFEIPLAAKKLAQTNRFNAIICLGAIIRGDTPHFEYLASEVTKGIANVSLETGTPIIFGILTTDNIEQAIERSGTKAGNRGFTAALDALEMIDLMSKISPRAISETHPIAEQEEALAEAGIRIETDTKPIGRRTRRFGKRQTEEKESSQGRRKRGAKKELTPNEKRSIAAKKMWERRRTKAESAKKEEISRKLSEAAKKRWEARRAKAAEEAKKRAEREAKATEEKNEKRSEAAKLMWIKRRAAKLKELQEKKEKLLEEERKPPIGTTIPLEVKTPLQTEESTTPTKLETGSEL